MKSRMRRCMRVALASLACRSGMVQLSLDRHLRNKRLCVLGLHRVLDRAERLMTASEPSIIIAAENFPLMLEYLSRRFQFVSLSDFLSGWMVDNRKPMCLLTFDDGWRDNYDHAYPVLKAMGIPALIFLTTGQLESQSPFWVERLRAACADAEILQRARLMVRPDVALDARNVTVEDLTEYLKRLPAENRNRIMRSLLGDSGTTNACDTMLDWAQVREMAANGIEFGGHTDTHPLLTYEDDDTIGRELRICKQKIEGAIGRTVLAFAYPNGDCDARVREHVRRVGFACGFTTQRGWYAPEEDVYSIPRVLLHDSNLVGRSNEFSASALAFTLVAHG